MHGLKPSPALDRRSFLYRAIQLAAVPVFPRCHPLYMYEEIVQATGARKACIVSRIR